MVVVKPPVQEIMTYKKLSKSLRLRTMAKRPLHDVVPVDLNQEPKRGGRQKAKARVIREPPIDLDALQERCASGFTASKVLKTSHDHCLIESFTKEKIRVEEDRNRLFAVYNDDTESFFLIKSCRPLDADTGKILNAYGDDAKTGPYLYCNEIFSTADALRLAACGGDKKALQRQKVEEAKGNSPPLLHVNVKHTWIPARCIVGSFPCKRYEEGEEVDPAVIFLAPLRFWGKK